MASSVTLKVPYFWVEQDARRQAIQASNGLSLLREQEFLQTLNVEVKRTTRSRKPFMLLLLSGSSVFETEGKTRALVDSVGSTIRSTDVLGWYKGGSVIGVLFPELEPGDRSAITVILDKIKHALQKNTRLAEDLGNIELSYDLYLQSCDEPRGERPHAKRCRILGEATEVKVMECARSSFQPHEERRVASR